MNNEQEHLFYIEEVELTFAAVIVSSLSCCFMSLFISSSRSACNTHLIMPAHD